MLLSFCGKKKVGKLFIKEKKEKYLLEGQKKSKYKRHFSSRKRKKVESFRMKSYDVL